MSKITTSEFGRPNGGMHGTKREYKGQKRNQEPLTDCRLNVLTAVFFMLLVSCISLLQWCKTYFRRISGILDQVDGK